MTFTIEIDDEDVLKVFYEADDATSQCDFPAIRHVLVELRDWSQTQMLRLTGEGMVLTFGDWGEPAPDAF